MFDLTPSAEEKLKVIEGLFRQRIDAKIVLVIREGGARDFEVTLPDSATKRLTELIALK